MLLQLAMRKHPELSEVPLIVDLVKKDDDLRALKLLYGTQVLGRPIFTAQSVPAERVAALRAAFDAGVKEPELLAVAKQRNLDIDPVSGRDMHALLEEVYAAPKSVVERVIGFRTGAR